MRLAPLAVLLLVSAGAAAQSGLTVSPERLFYQAETVVSISNETVDTIVLDSVAIRFGPVALRAYVIQATGPDSTYGSYYLNPSPQFSSSFSVGAGLEPQDTATLDIVGFDPCIACLDGGGGYGPDTLLIYSAGSAEPDTVVIDLSQYVAADAGPDAASAFSVEAYPNPATDGVAVRVDAGAEVSVVDARGRVVRRVRVEAGAGAVRVSTAGLALGAYVVRAVADDGRRASARFVVVR